MSSPSQIRSKVLNDKMSEFLTLLWQVNPTEYAAVEAKYAAFVDSLNAALRKTVTVLVKAEESAPTAKDDEDDEETEYVCCACSSIHIPEAEINMTLGGMICDECYNKPEQEDECCDYAECDGYCDDCHQNPKCRHN